MRTMKDYICGLVLWIVVVRCVLAVPDDSLDFQKTLPVQVVWAVEGKDVELPCDITPPTPQDSVGMILWFKDSIGIPLYSLDARGANLSEAHHLAVTNNEIGTRSYFLTGSEPSQARLRIHGVRASDEGVFRCRVDFSNSPTRNYKVNLTLVVQPSPPRIFDAQGHEVALASAGPFLQGHELFLSCQVTGGRPRPTVTWWQNGSLIDSVVDSSRDAQITVNQLLISRVTRQLWGTKLECRASSHDAAGYKSKEIGLIIYLTPQKVKISAPTELMSTRMPQLCRCETFGSYPPAKIVWVLGTKVIRNSSVTVSQTEDSTTSVLTLLPSPDDDGKELICRADNPRFPGGHMQDSRTVRVAYPPKATVHFQAGGGVTEGRGNGSAPLLKEGGYARMACKTVAVPPAFKFTWYHNGHLVEYNETAGTLPSDNVLELKNLDQHSQGEYACAAGNQEGETLSEPIRVKIQYAPRCREGHEVLHIGAIPHESLLVKCHVDASPPVVKFSWTYNNSRDVLPVQAANMNNNGVISQLHFTPGGHQGALGTLACWASNSVGRQRNPCLFHLLPANSLTLITPHESLLVKCHVDAAPPVVKFSWTYNNSRDVLPVQAANMNNNGVISQLHFTPGGHQGALGTLACWASNSVGRQRNPCLFHLLPANSLTLITPHESLLVKCHVDAAPPVVKFSWTYNNSRDVLPVQAANMNNNGVISQLHFTPGGHQGALGTLACWASNSVGRQRNPCLFHLLPAKLPQPPRDCSLRHPCPLCVEVICEAGEDGGLTQSFVLEVNDVSPSVTLGGAGSTTLSDQAKAPPVMRLQEPEPVFRVHALEPGREYQLAVYAQNARGRSEANVQLANVRVAKHQGVPDTEKAPSDSTKENDPLVVPTQHSLALVLGALIVGACVVIVGVVAITVVILRRRRTPRSSPAAPRRQDNKPEGLELRDCDAGFGEGFQRRSIEWRERNLRSSIFLDTEAPCSGRASQHITIGPDLILSPVSFPRPRFDEEYLSLAGQEALLHYPGSYATGRNQE